MGVFALHRPPFERFGQLLVVAGFVWFLTTLANAESSTPARTERDLVRRR